MKKHKLHSKLVSVLIISFLFLSRFETSHATVDMREASYIGTWVDAQVTDHLSLSRIYRSRSLRNGSFGFGWCSVADVSMQKVGTRSIRIKDCSGLDSTFHRSPVSHRSRERALDGPDFEDGALFEDPLRPGERIRVSGGTFLYFRSDGECWRFDETGQLLQQSADGGHRLRFSRDPAGRLLRIDDDDGNWIRLSTDPETKRVIEAETSKGERVHYRYKKDDLILAESDLLGTSRYEYDLLHNLTRILYPDQSFETLTYDSDRDTIKSFRSRNGCLETYRFLPLDQDPKLHFASESEKRCGERVVSKSRFEFWHHLLPTGHLILEKVRATRNETTFEVTNSNPVRTK